MPSESGGPPSYCRSRSFAIEITQRLTQQLEQEASLLEPTQLRERFELLDCLDVLLGDGAPSTTDPRFVDQQSVSRLIAIRAYLEAMNDELGHPSFRNGFNPILFPLVV
jgi:hypothetical protein